MFDLMNMRIARGVLFPRVQTFEGLESNGNPISTSLTLLASSLAFARLQMYWSEDT